jgi:hypothetical protein
VTSAETNSDLDLLRRFAPVIRYTQGELFLPSSVQDYVEWASLQASTSKGPPRVLAEHGGMTLERLAQLGREHPGDRLYLTFVEDALGRAEFRAWKQDPQRPHFTSSSRFAAVGILSRLIDGLMRMTLILRGKVPGGYAAAAALRMRQMPRYGEHPYYGHVARDGGYLVLQYWYFYAMNDWRSTFGGVNDHEADWEQVTIFLVDRGDEPPVPAWVAFSSHDEVGDDLRRRWDDPDIEFAGEHPVVYAGAGSHSGAYLPGEYIVSVEAPLPRFIERARRGFLRIFPWTDPESPGIGIPYIDYRRGDGPSIGAGQPVDWTPVLITDDTPWVRDYRGLWGLDTKDPLGGERAPAGPRYDRDGTVRESWGQPVAWAGLDKEAPTSALAVTALVGHREVLAGQLSELETELDEARAELRGARAADRAAGRSVRHPSPVTATLQERVTHLRHRQDMTVTELEAAERGLREPLPADGIHDHLKHRSVPLTDGGEMLGRRGRLLRLWSAASASILLAAIGVILILPDLPLLQPMLILIGAMVIIEATLRGRLLNLLGALLLAALTLLVVLVVIGFFIGQFRVSVGILLAFAALYMLWQTIHESIRTR